ncbi:hypothetical protein PUN28_012386 [Cardiocondyla obscurior]|uniref:Uncharacterized protein n=1 Tax=Cardiocondyla obscurior TaxID=286306 RepID=A0AAW2FG97_9HYME
MVDNLCLFLPSSFVILRRYSACLLFLVCSFEISISVLYIVYEQRDLMIVHNIELLHRILVSSYRVLGRTMPLARIKLERRRYTVYEGKRRCLADVTRGDAIAFTRPARLANCRHIDSRLERVPAARIVECTGGYVRRSSISTPLTQLVSSEK